MTTSEIDRIVGEGLGRGHATWVESRDWESANGLRGPDDFFSTTVALAPCQPPCYWA